MAQAGRAVIDWQENAEAGASGVNLDAPFSLQDPGKCALTHHPQAGGGTACGSRALSEEDPPDAHPASWQDRWFVNSLLPGKCGAIVPWLFDGAAPARFHFVGQ